MIYLASPYSDPLPEVMELRFRQACAVAAVLMKAGHVVFSPIAHTHPIAVAGWLPRGWDFWRRFDVEFVGASEAVAVIMLPGWQGSRGIAEEVRMAGDMGKPVFYLDPEKPLDGMTAFTV